jgi:predicted transcriptional regulator
VIDFGGEGVTIDQIVLNAAVTPAQAQTSCDRLITMGMVECVEDRYRLTEFGKLYVGSTKEGQ